MRIGSFERKCMTRCVPGRKRMLHILCKREDSLIVGEVGITVGIVVFSSRKRMEARKIWCHTRRWMLMIRTEDDHGLVVFHAVRALNVSEGRKRKSRVANVFTSTMRATGIAGL
jgi:hypothetical protein